MTKTIPGPAYRVLTPRLCIRCWNPEDAPALKAAVDASRAHLSPWMPWAQEETTLQMQIDRLRRVRADFDLGHDFVYAIFSRDESQVLGSTGLHTRVGDRAREIGYWIHADHIGQGYATETSAALTKVAFLVEGMDRVEIHCHPANAASARDPQKTGLHARSHPCAAARTGRMAKSRTACSGQIFADAFPGSPAAQIEIQAFDAAGREIPQSS